MRIVDAILPALINGIYIGIITYLKLDGVINWDWILIGSLFFLTTFISSLYSGMMFRS